MTARKKILAVLLSLSAAAIIGASLFPRTSPDEEFRLGQKALTRGKWSAVSRRIDRLRQVPGHADQVHVLRGGLLLRMGETRGAIAELVRVQANGPLHEQALLLLCEAFYDLKQWIEAAQLAREVLQRNPDQAEAHRWLGAIYYDLGANQQAITHLQELARLAPEDYSPHRLLGLIHKDFERYKDAIADYQQALERNPPREIATEIRLELAKAQIKLNDFAAALQTLDFAWPPHNAEPGLLSAECLWSLDRKDEARRAIQQAQSEASDDPKVLWLVARFALDEGRIQDAVSPLQQIVQADPFNHQALLELSLAYRKLGQEAEADRLLVRRNAAHALLVQLVELNKQAMAESNNAGVRDDLASVCDQLGKKELAAAWRDAAQALRSTANRR